MALLDTVPSSNNAMAYMIGAVAFQRSFTELYAVIQDAAPGSVEEARETFNEGMHLSSSAVLDVARKYVVQVYGGQCDVQEMKAALKGYMAEAQDRFVMRAAEIEVVKIENWLRDVHSSEQLSSDWKDAADAFRS